MSVMVCCLASPEVVEDKGSGSFPLDELADAAKVAT